MALAEIIAIRDVGLDFNRPGQITHKEITYRIDMSQPYQLFIPIAEWSAAKGLAAVDEKRQEWEQVVGKPIGGP